MNDDQLPAPDDSRDLDGLAHLRADTPGPDASVLAAARARLVDHTERATARPAVLALTPRRRNTPPVRWRIAASLAAAAVVAGGAYALTTDDPSTGPGPQAASTAPGTSTAPATIRFVNASQVLDAASANAVTSQVPAAGQYLHVRSHSYDVTTIDEPPNHGAFQLTENRGDLWTPTSGTAYQRQVSNISVDYPSAKQRAYAASLPDGVPTRGTTWTSISPDGTYTQLYPKGVQQPSACTDPGCSSGVEPGATVWEQPDSVDLASVPRDPAALRTSLYEYATELRKQVVRAGKGDQATTDDIAYGGLTTAITSATVPGDLRSALYQVAKTIPGIKLFGSLANYDGTKGIAVGRIDTFHVEHDLIFTDNGSTYLGDRTIARAPSVEYDVPAGTLLGATAVTVDVTGKPDVPR